MRRFALVIAAAWLGFAAPAGANGRAPTTQDIHFRVGHEQDVIAGLTFGLVISHDGGTSWHWMCEAAVQYGGMFDPVYDYSPSGALFATSFHGFRVMRDG